MPEPDYFNELRAAIEVCDRDGILLYVNDLAAETVAGRDQIGTNILDCHPEPARLQLAEMLASGEANVYTIEKGGRRKLVYQAPWYVDGVYSGFIEMVLPLPDNMPHFVRDAG
jgi:PAS domain-containing protein